MSTDSLKELLLVRCLRCGFTRQKRIDRPVKCPSCQTRNWDKPFRTKVSESEPGDLSMFDGLRKKLKE